MWKHVAGKGAGRKLAAVLNPQNSLNSSTVDARTPSVSNSVVAKNLSKDRNYEEQKEKCGRCYFAEALTSRFAWSAGAALGAIHEALRVGLNYPPEEDRQSCEDSQLSSAPGIDWWELVKPLVDSRQFVVPNAEDTSVQGAACSSKAYGGHSSFETWRRDDAVEHLGNEDRNLRATTISTAVQTDDLKDLRLTELKSAEDRFQSVMADYESHLQNSIGMDLARAGLWAEAFQYFLRGVRLGNPRCQYNLGMCYYKGHGTPANMNRAVAAWRRAAERGHAGASYQLGVCQLRGLGGLVPDKRAALASINKAAEAGFGQAIEFGKALAGTDGATMDAYLASLPPGGSFSGSACAKARSNSSSTHLRSLHKNARTGGQQPVQRRRNAASRAMSPGRFCKHRSSSSSDERANVDSPNSANSGNTIVFAESGFSSESENLKPLEIRPALRNESLPRSNTVHDFRSIVDLPVQRLETSCCS